MEEPVYTAPDTCECVAGAVQLRLYRLVGAIRPDGSQTGQMAFYERPNIFHAVRTVSPTVFKPTRQGKHLNTELTMFRNRF